uniref:Putative licpodalin-4 1 n=1 Tax=Ixodes ricinus TaxID=34613 RepID=V5HJ43_IXORI
MYLLSLLAIFCLLMGSYSQDTLPEDDPANFDDQDATKMAGLTGKHWVKRRTYAAPSSRGEATCEYAQIVSFDDGKGKTNYILELGAKFGETWIRRNQTLTLKTSGQHPQPNVMQFVRNRADELQEHKLLYSDYDSCSIVRIKRKTAGLFCDLLLYEGAADAEPPSPCKEKFQQYCSGGTVEVYTPDCRTQE